MRNRIDLLRPGFADFFGQFDQAALVAVIFCTQRSSCNEVRAFDRLAFQIRHAALEFFSEFVLPRAEYVAPRLDGEFIDRVLEERAGRFPSVVDERSHRCLVPFLAAGFAPLEDGGDDIVAVLEDIGFDDEVFAGCALDGITAAMNERRDVFDDDGGLVWNHVRPLLEGLFANNKSGSVQTFSPPGIARCCRGLNENIEV